MTIKKYAHACLLIEINGAKILADVGSWNETPDATGVDAILITHEHMDHFEPEKLKAVMAKNPDARIITHAEVGAKLAEAGLKYEVIEPGQSLDVKGVSIESFGTDHAIIYGTTPPCRNTGFLIGGELFITGDALHDVPPKPVRVLALPTGGPWMKLAEAIDYAKAVQPKIVFPVHDAMHTEVYQSMMVPRLLASQLNPVGIEVVEMPAGATKEF